MPDWAWWLVAAVIFAMGELVVFTGFILGPLAVVALVTAVVAAFGASIEIQLAVFAILGLASILTLRPIAKRNLDAPPKALTNVDALINKRARVLETMTADQVGMIRLENENWTASPIDGVAKIEAQAYVRVVRIAGATAIVEPYTESESSTEE